MPNYEYKCLKCGHQFEALLPAGTQNTKCLECGDEKAQKLLSAPGVQFKGGGFYKTDSQSNQPSKKDVSSDASNSSNTNE